MKINRFVSGYVRFLKRTYWIILPVMLLISAYALGPTVHLFSNINTNLKALLPEDHPTVLVANDIGEKFEDYQGVTVVLEFDKPKEGPDYLPIVADAVMKSPYVNEAIYRRKGYDFFKNNGLLFLSVDRLNKLHDRMDREIQKRKLGALYIDFESDDTGEGDEPFNLKTFKGKYAKELSDFPSEYFSNEEEKVYTIKTHSPNPSADFTYMQEALDSVKGIVNALPEIRDGRVKVYYYGGFVSRLDEYRTLMHDLRLAGIVALIGIMLFLTWRFRRPDALIYIFVPFACALSWDFAITASVIGQLNVVTAFLFSILFGLGVDFGIHLLARYWEQRRAGSDAVHAAEVMLQTTGKSCLTAGFTTAAAFYLMLINDFNGFSEFGFIAGTGLVLSVLGFFIIMPCLLFTSEKIGLGYPKKYSEPALTLFNIGWKRARIVVPAFVVIFVISIVACIPLLRFEFDFKKLKARIESTEVARDKMRESVGGRGTAAAILVKDEDDIPKLKKIVNEISGDPDAITYQFYYYDGFLPEKQEEKKAVIARINDLLADDIMDVLKDDEIERLDEFRAMMHPQTITDENLPEAVRYIFYGKEDVPGQVVYVRPKLGIELDNGLNAMKFAGEVGEIDIGDRVYHSSSMNMIFADVLKTMLSDSKRTIPLLETRFNCLCALGDGDWIDARNNVRCGHSPELLQHGRSAYRLGARRGLWSSLLPSLSRRGQRLHSRGYEAHGECDIRDRDDDNARLCRSRARESCRSQYAGSARRYRCWYLSHSGGNIFPRIPALP